MNCLNYSTYLVNGKNETYLTPLIDLEKWKMSISDYFILLIRAHYAVIATLSIKESEFVKDVFNCQYLNDPYLLLIS